MNKRRSRAPRTGLYLRIVTDLLGPFRRIYHQKETDMKLKTTTRQHNRTSFGYDSSPSPPMATPHTTEKRFTAGRINTSLRRFLVLSILAPLILVACGRKPQAADVPPGGISDEMAIYIDLFTKLAAEENIHITNQLYSAKMLDKEDWIAFRDQGGLTPDTIGLCSTIDVWEEGSFPNYERGPTETFRYATVLRIKDPLYQKALIFHELGHCLLNLDHSEMTDDIMYASVPRMKDDREFEMMLNRLFQAAAQR